MIIKIKCIDELYKDIKLLTSCNLNQAICFCFSRYVWDDRSKKKLTSGYILLRLMNIYHLVLNYNNIIKKISRYFHLS